MEHSPPPFFKRGPSPLARLTLFTVASLLLMAGDARFKVLDGLRQAIAVALYPLQRAATAPATLATRAGEFFVTQGTLAEDNARLRQQQLGDAGRLQRLAALEAENAQLRRLLEARARFAGNAVAAEVLYGGRDPFRRRIVVDRGTRHAVQAGQAVVDDAGVVGQVTRAYPWVAEVTLVSDKDHAVPVQVLRSGLRAIAFGSGEEGLLELRFMAGHADIQTGDLLVTSGIDGTYPAGLPVATVTRIERSAAHPFARITCTPVAGVDRHRQVLVLARRDASAELAEPAAEPAEPRAKPKKGKRGN